MINNDWGCPKSMVNLFGFSNPDNLPLAELWMGAHPKAPSSIILDVAKTRPLDEYISQNPKQYLGDECAEKFSNKLSFLFKVLSAQSPLSIQSHPNKEQAIEGWKKENEARIPLHAYNRNYKDDNHKPELVYAITEFHALNGFREYSQIYELFTLVQSSYLKEKLETFARSMNSEGLKEFYYALMTNPQPTNLVLEIIENISERLEKNLDPKPLENLWKLIISIHNKYPGDVGVLSPLLINYVVLQPGEAMFLEAGTLHAYLKGTSLELMANSDNVLRGGLTSKHVDIEELLRTTVFEPIAQDKIKLSETQLTKYEHTYPTDVDDFRLNIIELKNNMTTEVKNVNSAEILFIAQGHVRILTNRGDKADLIAGQSCFISAENESYTINGIGKVARAFTPT